MCGKSATYAPKATDPAVKAKSSYQYVIRRGSRGMFVRLDASQTFANALDGVKDATRFPTATYAEAAIKHRNEKMSRVWSGYGKEVFLIVPVKVTETTEMVATPVTTFVDTPVTKTTVELA